AGGRGRALCRHDGVSTGDGDPAARRHLLLLLLLLLLACSEIAPCPWTGRGACLGGRRRGRRRGGRDRAVVAAHRRAARPRSAVAVGRRGVPRRSFRAGPRETGLSPVPGAALRVAPAVT